MMAGKDPNARGSVFENEKTLFIGNLPEHVYENDLTLFFKSKGFEVSKIRIQYDPVTNQSRRFGFLNFKSEEEANKCLEACKNTEIGGRQITLSRKKDNIERDSQANLHVKNLPESLTQKDLEILFKDFGTIITCKLELSQDNKSRGFGYVQFSQQSEANEAMQKMNGYEVDGKKLSVTVLTRRNDRPEVMDNFTNLYVSNLPDNLTDEEFLQIFTPFGEIQNSKYNREKRCGYVKYYNHSQAQEAIDSLNQKKQFNGNCIFVQKHISAVQNQMMTGPMVQNIGQQMKKNY